MKTTASHFVGFIHAISVYVNLHLCDCYNLKKIN